MCIRTNLHTIAGFCSYSIYTVYTTLTLLNGEDVIQHLEFQHGTCRLVNQMMDNRWTNKGSMEETFGGEDCFIMILMRHFLLQAYSQTRACRVYEECLLNGLWKRGCRGTDGSFMHSWSTVTEAIVESDILRTMLQRRLKPTALKHYFQNFFM